MLVAPDVEGNQAAPVLSAFRRAEKLYKACGSADEAVAAGALDLHRPSEQALLVQRGETRVVWGRSCTELSFAGYCGVHVLCGALDRKQQVELAYNALHECLAPPNCTNLHAHWDVSKRAELDTIWQCDGPLLDDSESAGLSRSTTLSRVRWATLGFQYNWTERSYSKSKFVPFPARLCSFAQELALRCGSGFDMHAEAAIVNFYPEGQVMGGHQDDGEEALESPVVSLSIGSPCVFLLGGRDKDEAPLALLLRSGDVLILGGESRLRYHGVPRVWVQAEGPPAYLHPDTEAGQVHTSACPAFLEPEAPLPFSVSECSCGGVTATEVRRALRYLQWARININLRQVFRDA